MNLRKCLVFTSFFVLTGLPIRAQQTVSETNHPTTAQADTSSSASTVDGLPSCPANSHSGTLADGPSRVDGSILPPKAINTPDPTFSDEQRKYARSAMKKEHIKRFETSSIIGLVVDTNGLPRDLCVAKEAGHGFDERALAAVEEYRFKPALRDGKPVPVRLAVEVKFALW